MVRLLRSLQRWAGLAPPGASWPAVTRWAEESGYSFRRERDDRGFVVEGPLAGRTWRLEWGPSQRDYLEGRELRLRCDLGLPQDLQMMVMSAKLMDSLEREAFGRFTEGAQTETDLDVPEEMRWLALFRKADLSRLRHLRTWVGGVASMAGTVETWMDDPAWVQLLERAVDPGSTGVARLDPLVIMTLRGRVYLRTLCEDPTPDILQQAQRLFASAALRAQAVAAGLAEVPFHAAERTVPLQGPPGAEPDGPSTAWQTRLGPSGD